MEILKPRKLNPGDTLGILAPSTPAHFLFPEKYRHGLEELRRAGFNIREGKLTKKRNHQGYRTAPARERAAELMELICDDQVQGIMTVIGGYNSASLLPYLDYQKIREKRKIFCGYSDITALHMAMLTQAGLSSFYGPAVVPSFGEWPSVLDYTLESFLSASTGTSRNRVLTPPEVWSNHFLDAFTDAWKTVPREFKPNSGWKVLIPGCVTGRIVAGNLNTLLTLAGTPYFPDLEGKILIIEEMTAPLGLEERSFNQLLLMGVFDKISGLVLGKPEKGDSGSAPFSCDELLLEMLGPRAYPVISNFDCGHTHPMITLGQDLLITLDAEAEVRITLNEAMVE